MGNFFGGSTSLAIDRFDRLGDQGDNGVYVIDGWGDRRANQEQAGRGLERHRLARHRPVRGAARVRLRRHAEVARRGHAEGLRLGDFLDSVEVPVRDVEPGDEVWMRTVGGKWEAFPVVGLGQPRFNRIAVTVDTPDGGRDIAYPDLPYVAMHDHDGDFSRNSNNYVHGDTARIRPRS